MSGLVLAQKVNIPAGAFPPSPAAFSAPVAIGTVIVAGMNFIGTDPGTVTLSDNVNTGNYLPIVNFYDTTSGQGWGWWWIVANATGTPTISASLQHASFGGIIAGQVTGFVGTPTVDTTLTNQWTGASSPIAVTAITGFLNEILFIGQSQTSVAYPSPWTDFTIGSPGGATREMGYVISSTAGTNDNFNAATGGVWSAALVGIYDFVPTASTTAKLYANGQFQSHNFIEGGSQVSTSGPLMKMYSNSNTQIISMNEVSLYQLNKVVSNTATAPNGGTQFTVCPITVANTGDLLCIAFFTGNGAIVNANVNGVSATFIGNCSSVVFENDNLYYFYMPNVGTGAVTVVAQSNTQIAGMIVADYSGPNTNPFLGTANNVFAGNATSSANNIYSGNVAITAANNVLVWGLVWDPQAPTSNTTVSIPQGSNFSQPLGVLSTPVFGGYLDFSDEVITSGGNANAVFFTTNRFAAFGVGVAVFALNPPLPNRLYANGQMCVNSFFEV